MRLLLLTQWYPPEPMRFLGEMAESLQELGHEVRVLTGFPNWPAGRLYPGYRLSPRVVETVGGVVIRRVPLYPYHGYSAVGRVLNLASFVAAAAIGGLCDRWRPDLVHVVQPPTTCVAGWLLARRWGVPFTYEIQDMWPETLRATGLVRRASVLRVVARYCSWVYRQSAGLRVISPGFGRDLIAKGVPVSKIAVIPNWVDTEFFSPACVDRQFAASIGLNNSFTVLYAGTVGLAQGLDTLVDAAAALRDLPRIRIVVAGDGLDLPRLSERAARLGLSNVTFLGRLPEEQMPRLYSVAQVAVVHLKRDDLFRMTIPHKVLTYLAAGKPVVAAVEGDAAALVADAGAGIVCSPEEPIEMARAIKRMYASPNELNTMADRARRAACASYSREKLVKDLENFLTQRLNKQEK